MPHCVECALSFEGNQCPGCGAAPALTKAQVNQALKMHTYTLVAGLGGVLLATYKYPPLDQNLVMISCILVFFAPIVTLLVFSIRKRLASDFDLLKNVYKWAGVLLVVFAVILILNGALDSQPPTEVRANVIRKSASRGRHGTSYSLTVGPSWRPGKVDERVQVGRTTFSKVQPGQPVAIELHAGTLGLPWYSRVVPRGGLVPGGY